MRNAILLVVLAFTTAANAQSLTKDEKKIMDRVTRNLPQSLQLLENLVNINSGTLNVEGVKKVGSLLRQEYDKIGFATEWITLPDSLKRAGHLVASKKGKKGKRVLLIGHLDTVFEPDMPANPYRKINDSTVTGQGVNDMKGGDVVMLAALQALNELGYLKSATVTAYYTGDEEKSGVPDEVSRADFRRRAQEHDIALGFETAQGRNVVATARRGSSSWHLNVWGRQGHSAGIFNNSYGAIYEAARILNAFREELSTQMYLTFNPGLIAGGTEVSHDSSLIQASIAGKTNIISPMTVVQGDLRFLRESQKDSARARMAAIVATGNLPGTKAAISFSDGIPSMEPTDGNQRLAGVVNEVSLAMGMGPTRAGDPGSRGAGDISYIARYLDCLDGLGVIGSGAHAPGETMNLTSFQQMVQRAALLIYRLTR